MAPTPPKFRTIESLDFGDFEIYPDKTGRYSVHGSQLKDLITKRDLDRDSLVKRIAQERDTAVEQRRAAEEKDAKGVAAIATLQAANEKLTKERDANETQAKYHFDRAQVLIGNLAAVADERDAARARIKTLEGSAEPAAWCSVSNFGISVSVNRDGRFDTPLYRHPPKPTGKPLAYRVVHSNGYTVFAKEQNAVAAYPGCTVTPLYEAPPVALGVEGKRFACLVALHPNDFLRSLEFCKTRHLGTRAEAEAAARGDEGASVVRIVPADAPAVDLTLVRKALRMLHRYGGNAELEQAAADLRAAIGEKAGD